MFTVFTYQGQIPTTIYHSHIIDEKATIHGHLWHMHHASEIVVSLSKSVFNLLTYQSGVGIEHDSEYDF